MERLTKYNCDGSVDYNDDYTLKEVIACLAELEDKLESGQLVELPCKVGDKLYVIEKLINSGEWVLCNDFANEEYIVTNIYLNINKPPKFQITHLYGTAKLEDFGDTIFLTREAAEAKLKELREKK